MDRKAVGSPIRMVSVSKPDQVNEELLERYILQVATAMRSCNWPAAKHAIDECASECVMIEGVTHNKKFTTFTPLSEIGLKSRTLQIFDSHGYSTIGDVLFADAKELLRLSNVGAAMVRELQQCLKKVRWIYGPEGRD